LLADCPTPKALPVADTFRKSPEPADLQNGPAGQNGDEWGMTLGGQVATNAKADANPIGRSLPGVHPVVDIASSNNSDGAKIVYTGLDKSASRSIKTGGFDDLNVVPEASALPNNKAASGNRKGVAVAGFDVAAIGGIAASHVNRAAPVVGTFDLCTSTGNGKQTARTLRQVWRRQPKLRSYGGRIRLLEPDRVPRLIHGLGLGLGKSAGTAASGVQFRPATCIGVLLK
jgi:hypothetical protein